MVSDATIRAWLNGFAACVRRRDFEAGARHFRRQVYCFGSYASACRSLPSLVTRQWKRVWPNITGFRFRMAQMRCHVSADGRLACVMAPWRSVGYRANRRSFARDGRVTILLSRASRRAPWRAFHTHYSLNPGTLQTAVRRRAARAR